MLCAGAMSWSLIYQARRNCQWRLFTSFGLGLTDSSSSVVVFGDSILALWTNWATPVHYCFLSQIGLGMTRVGGYYSLFHHYKSSHSGYSLSWCSYLLAEVDLTIEKCHGMHRALCHWEDSHRRSGY